MWHSLLYQITDLHVLLKNLTFHFSPTDVQKTMPQFEETLMIYSLIILGYFIRKTSEERLVAIFSKDITADILPRPLSRNLSIVIFVTIEEDIFILVQRDKLSKYATTTHLCHDVNRT